MSVQLDRYLQLRANGATMMTASMQAEIPVAEARLIENDIARGLLTLPAAATSSTGSISSFEPIDCGGCAPPVLVAAETPVQPPKENIMARKAKPSDRATVTNLSETKDVIREAVAKIVKLRGDRKEINAAIGEQRARVKNYGVPPAALDLALRMKEADPEDRQRHDEGYAIARDALGLGLQRSLFEAIEEPVANPDGNASLSKARSHLTPVPDAVG